MEVAAAHFDDRAEAAIEGAAARGLHHVDLPPHHGVAVQHAGAALGQADFVAFQAVHRTRRILCQPSSADTTVLESHRSLRRFRSPAAIRETSARLRRARCNQFRCRLPCRLRARGWDRSRPPRRARRDAASATIATIRSAVLRWKVMTERPTTSGLISRTSRSTVSRTFAAPGSGRRRRLGDADRRFLPAKSARHWACAPRPWACARTSRAWIEGEYSRRRSDGPHGLKICWPTCYTETGKWTCRSNQFLYMRSSAENRLGFADPQPVAQPHRQTRAATFHSAWPAPQDTARRNERSPEGGDKSAEASSLRAPRSAVPAPHREGRTLRADRGGQQMRRQCAIPERRP